MTTEKNSKGKFASTALCLSATTTDGIALRIALNQHEHLECTLQTNEETMDMDDNMILIYFNQQPQPSQHAINGTISADDVASEIHYYRAILAFLLVIIIYFCLVCHVWKEEVAEGKPAVINRSLVTKKVLPHGQSQRFDERDDVISLESQHKPKRFRCCHCRSPSTDPSSSVIESYRLKSYIELRKHKLQQRLQNEHPELATRDELVLAEEGNTSITDLVCPVCLDAFHIGEEVTWSRLQHCRHVFHHECLMPWAVLGHVHCPVCREVFWSRHAPAIEEESCLICSCVKLRRKLESRHDKSALEQSKFCVIHGLVSPTDATQ